MIPMKVILAIFLACTLLPTAALGAAAENVPPASAAPVASVAAAEPSATLTALGTATVSLGPDTAVLTFTVNDTASSVEAAQNASTATLETLYASLESLGLTAEDSVMVSSGVKTLYAYQYGKLGEGETPSSYSVTSTVVITLRDLTQLSTVIDIAIASGMDYDYELHYQSTQESAARDEALGLAAGEAMRKAALLAQASGVTLGSITAVRECPAEMPAVSDNVQLINSLHYLLDVTATVEVTYQIK